MELKNKIVIITGGSQGFGKALAEHFVSESSKVVISSHDENILALSAKELSCDYFVADVTLVNDIQKLGQYVFDKYGAIDIWINNAGIQIAPEKVENIDSEKIHNLFNINFFGYFYGCQIALTYFKRVNDGLIININSTAGLKGKPEISGYSASKFAIKGLTESTRRELKDLNIKIYQIFPGGMKTEIYKEKYPSDLQDYMDVDSVAKKVIENLKSNDPIIDFVIKRPLK